MKQIAQNYKTGELAQVEVPAPACKAGGVIVRTHFSLVSAGTEMMKVKESKLSLIGKARARPDQVKKVMQSVSQQGVMATYQKVMNRLDSLTPLGYSLCGEVVEVGADVQGLQRGQRVACGGDKYAHHAEYNWVPHRLCVPVPDGVASEHAAFTTVGAIAMQGLRQAEVGLGETACIVGLGLIGQLLVQLLHAAGVQVVGVDISEERCQMARQLGAVATGTTDPASLAAMQTHLDALTNGAGADVVFLAAGGASNQPVELAADVARDRARIVDIGKCKLDLPWKDYYAKELDVRFSRSYGPGRYDPNFEEAGHDYPIGYVRWTEQRNMQCFVDLLASSKVDISPLVSTIVPFEQAVDTYEAVNRGEIMGLGVLFRYAADIPLERRIATPHGKSAGRHSAAGGTGPKVRLGLIGCGNYASSMLLPHLVKRQDVQLVEVATATALSAANAQRKFGFERMSTDFRGMLDDDNLDAVLILTRHSSHAAMVCEALRAGKAVFVEKPLAVRPEQLNMIVQTIEETGNARLTVGFNRRFAPLLSEMKARWGATGGPLTLRYNVNAGQLESDSWYGQADSEGSRFVGEGCHFVDTASWWLGREPVEVFATNTSDDPDNVLATLFYDDGSRAHLTYLTQGDSKYPKETFEVFGQGRVAQLDNFRQAEVWTSGTRAVMKSRGGIDKGQKMELARFIEAVKNGESMPIPLESLIATTQATFAAARSIANRRIEPVAPQEPAAPPAEATNGETQANGAIEVHYIS